MVRLQICVVALVALLCSFFISTPAYAQGSEDQNCGSGSIAHGIWAGFNAVFGGDTNCSDSNDEDVNVPAPSAAEPTTNEATVPTYYALGDSVAAGDGLGLQTTGASGCVVSDEAYPSLVAAELGTSIQNYACSGATAGDLLTEQHLPNTSADIEPQLYTAFDGGVPDYMTITAGANDLYWENYLRFCYQQTCGKSFDSTAVAGLRSLLRAKLEAVFASIQVQSGDNPPTVLVTGYYEPLSVDCSELQNGLSSREISWLNRQTRLLNSTIRRAANNYDFVQYVDVDYSGHELCTNDSWIQGVSDPAPFHPTAAGQQAIAESIIQHINQ